MADLLKEVESEKGEKEKVAAEMKVAVEERDGKIKEMEEELKDRELILADMEKEMETK